MSYITETYTPLPVEGTHIALSEVPASAGLEPSANLLPTTTPPWESPTNLLPTTTPPWESPTIGHITNIIENQITVGPNTDTMENQTTVGNITDTMENITTGMAYDVFESLDAVLLGVSVVAVVVVMLLLLIVILRYKAHQKGTYYTHEEALALKSDPESQEVQDTLEDLEALEDLEDLEEEES